MFTIFKPGARFRRMNLILHPKDPPPFPRTFHHVISPIYAILGNHEFLA
jgi:hypothetical protein